MKMNTKSKNDDLNFQVQQTSEINKELLKNTVGDINNNYNKNQLQMNFINVKQNNALEFFKRPKNFSQGSPIGSYYDINQKDENKDQQEIEAVQAYIKKNLMKNPIIIKLEQHLNRLDKLLKKVKYQEPIQSRLEINNKNSQQKDSEKISNQLNQIKKKIQKQIQIGRKQEMEIQENNDLFVSSKFIKEGNYSNYYQGIELNNQEQNKNDGENQKQVQSQVFQNQNSSLKSRQKGQNILLRNNNSFELSPKLIDSQFSKFRQDIKKILKSEENQENQDDQLSYSNQMKLQEKGEDLNYFFSSNQLSSQYLQAKGNNNEQNNLPLDIKRNKSEQNIKQEKQNIYQFQQNLGSSNQSQDHLLRNGHNYTGKRKNGSFLSVQSANQINKSNMSQQQSNFQENNSNFIINSQELAKKNQLLQQPNQQQIRYSYSNSNEFRKKQEHFGTGIYQKKDAIQTGNTQNSQNNQGNKLKNKIPFLDLNQFQKSIELQYKRQQQLLLQTKLNIKKIQNLEDLENKKYNNFHPIQPNMGSQSAREYSKIQQAKSFIQNNINNNSENELNCSFKNDQDWNDKNSQETESIYKKDTNQFNSQRKIKKQDSFDSLNFLLSGSKQKKNQEKKQTQQEKKKEFEKLISLSQNHFFKYKKQSLFQQKNGPIQNLKKQFISYQNSPRDLGKIQGNSQVYSLAYSQKSKKKNEQPVFERLKIAVTLAKKN
ncbi:hypothetical protein PPERSA_00380 [Pseudocohnilembus persalinus]|uniref:Uncharacterized protein n=1 Tax=Pseudocohnilembus persalinus TaxID=266149 RepID=A0A0V0QY56_PSEPJ|nr:hypothetical protein PPERSA_00380 [Pseudocohnilembus persalinus]|eukprot:KRX07223.1 hypothetical protein PPERSA_00380 [Pseudocohnilembus persalinus]